jgi:hypothetical protein
MHSHRPPSLKFAWLQYEVIDIQTMLAKYPSLEYFVFPYYLPETAAEDKTGALQLLSYAYTGNAYAAEVFTLPVYKDNALKLSGPVIMSNNTVSKANILKAIAPDDHGVTPDYLVMIPEISAGNYISYRFRRHVRIPNAPDPVLEMPGNDEPIETNPSPPATY